MEQQGKITKRVEPSVPTKELYIIILFHYHYLLKQTPKTKSDSAFSFIFVKQNWDLHMNMQQKENERRDINWCYNVKLWLLIPLFHILREKWLSLHVPSKARQRPKRVKYQFQSRESSAGPLGGRVLAPYLSATNSHYTYTTTVYSLNIENRQITHRQIQKPHPGKYLTTKINVHRTLF